MNFNQNLILEDIYRITISKSEYGLDALRPESEVRSDSLSSQGDSLSPPVTRQEI